jgi:hypothetical protein
MPGVHDDERRRPVLARVNYGAPPEHDILAIAAPSVQEMFEFAAQASFWFRVTYAGIWSSESWRQRPDLEDCSAKVACVERARLLRGR